MRFLLLAGLAIAPAASAAGPEEVQPAVPHSLKVLNPVPKHCPSVAGYHTQRRGGPLAPKKLTELPPANAYHAVYRLGADGCPDPVMVGYQFRGER